MGKYCLMALAIGLTATAGNSVADDDQGLVVSTEKGVVVDGAHRPGVTVGTDTDFDDRSGTITSTKRGPRPPAGIRNNYTLPPGMAIELNIGRFGIGGPGIGTIYLMGDSIWQPGSWGAYGYGRQDDWYSPEQPKPHGKR